MAGHKHSRIQHQDVWLKVFRHVWNSTCIVTPQDPLLPFKCPYPVGHKRPAWFSLKVKKTSGCSNSHLSDKIARTLSAADSVEEVQNTFHLPHNTLSSRMHSREGSSWFSPGTHAGSDHQNNGSWLMSISYLLLFYSRIKEKHLPWTRGWKENKSFYMQHEWKQASPQGVLWMALVTIYQHSLRYKVLGFFYRSKTP